MNRTKQEVVQKCFKSNNNKPRYFEPWFLPRYFSQIYRIILLIYALDVWRYREYYLIKSLKKFFLINLELTVISNDQVIYYCILGIQLHFETEFTTYKNLVRKISFVWSACLLWKTILFILFWTVLHKEEVSYYNVSAHGVQTLCCFLPFLWEFTYIRWKLLKWLYLPFFIVVILVLPWYSSLCPLLDYQNIGLTNYFIYGVLLSFLILGIFSLIWIISYKIERQISGIYDIPFKDNAVLSRLRLTEKDKVYNISRDQHTFSMDFESQKINKDMDNNLFDIGGTHIINNEI